MEKKIIAQKSSSDNDIFEIEEKKIIAQKSSSDNDIFEIEEKKMIVLKSSDNQIFEIEEAAAMRSTTISHLIEDGVYDGTPIFIPNVSSYVLELVIEYCHRHAAFEKYLSAFASTSTNIDDLKKSDIQSDDIHWSTLSSDSAASASVPDFTYSTKIDYDGITKFDKEFVDVDWDTLFDIIKAASYLNIKSLIDLTCYSVYKYTVSNLEEAYHVFNIKKDFTPEEEAQIYKEHDWAFLLYGRYLSSIQYQEEEEEEAQIYDEHD